MRHRFFLGAIASCVVPLPVPVPETEPLPEMPSWNGRFVGMTQAQFAEAVRPSFEETVLQQIAAGLGIPKAVLYGNPKSPSLSVTRLVTSRAECERLLGRGSWPFSEERP